MLQSFYLLAASKIFFVILSAFFLEGPSICWPLQAEKNEKDEWNLIVGMFE